MTDATPPRWLVAGTCCLAVFIAITSLGGLYEPSIYAQETASWTAQGIGQDVVNLLVVVPLLLACAAGIARSSRAAVLMLGGAFAYTLYSYVLYAFAMHFNALFLVYCAALGTSFFGLVDIASYVRGREWIVALPNRRTVGTVLVGVGVAFGALWLSSIIPALVDGRTPRELAEVGLITNPVHILDLAIVLPGFIVTGVLVLLGQPAGFLLAAVALTFETIMALALLGMQFASWQSGLSVALPVVIAVGGLEVISAALLFSVLRRLGGERPVLSWLDQPHRL